MEVVPSVRLDRSGWEQVKVFFERNARLRLHETAEHYADPLVAPDAFFESELREPAHQKVFRAVQSNRGVFDASLVQEKH